LPGFFSFFDENHQASSTLFSSTVQPDDSFSDRHLAPHAENFNCILKAYQVYFKLKNHNKMAIQDNIKNIQTRINQACARVQRSPEAIRIVAVTKTVNPAEIKQAIAAGINILGENRVQEGWQKAQDIGQKVSWHLIGHLQTNKVKRALQFADVIESLDSIRLAIEINHEAVKFEKTATVFVQINTSGETSKYGIEPEKAIEFAESIATLKNLKVSGLMTIGPLSANPEQIRACFRQLALIKEKINNVGIPNVCIEHLSMGMSEDFEIAIEEGATLLRIGRAIFGAREQ
jgi:PLP dependent protein